MIEASGVDDGIYWVKIRPWPWPTLHNQAVDWCLDRFGIDGPHNWYYVVLGSRFHFTKKDQLTLFLLRWS